MLDYIVIGQGIAGSCIALELLERKKTFLVIDDSHGTSSTKVAAGLIDAVYGKRFSRFHNTARLLSYSLPYYKTLEEKWRIPLLKEIPTLRLFSSFEEIFHWRKKGIRQDYNGIFGRFIHPSTDVPVHAPYGGTEVLGTGFLDTRAFLSKVKEILQTQHCYLAEKINYNDIHPQTDFVKWHHHVARRIIFCEGYKMKDNPWLANLPFNQAKGEILTLKMDGLKENYILNKKQWLVPLGNNTYKFGATYDHDTLDIIPTIDGKNQLLHLLKSFSGQPASLLMHEAGVRPMVKDIRPVIGKHPHWLPLIFFNGLGSRGIIQAPYYANQLLRHLDETLPLDGDADIKRFAI